MNIKNINDSRKWIFENGPEFMIIGAAKCGTTTLYTYLNKHPELYLPQKKEPEFFSDPDVYEKGYAWYKELYVSAHLGSKKGDASTTYTRWPHTLDSPKLIYENTRVRKFIYMMRNPVDRAYSHYAHIMRKGISMSFEDSLEAYPIIFDTGNYYTQLKRYLKYFERKDFLFITLEEFKSKPAEHLSRILFHLGASAIDLTMEGQEQCNKGGEEYYLRSRTVDKWKKSPFISLPLKFVPKKNRSSIFNVLKNSSYGKRLTSDYNLIPMKIETRNNLVKRYAVLNTNLTELTGIDISEWN